ncbi:hypothetical protein JHK82_049814 [Glycine max]|uniref:Cellulose synthase n=1 Tax=Glycine max TaxID=3847 RepID=A0A0R0FA81_SOYBN|nr:hypothetical protein JHK87_049485 [Glycine soja]KAG4935517.1 hypothetical protein JHK85_050436 [Glycine max]KAG5091036.1 hypothetical protein JHK82_049814 [Glycine max]KAG5094137.1 hypothetical protein JHK84_049725 [Glycine max]
MHCHGWRSVYCMPKRPAFKGSAPINLSYRLHQVLRWALGSVEIFFSRHCPIWYGYGGGLKSLERFSYINSVVYPLTSIPLISYCALPVVCLLTRKFIVPEISNYASIIFMALFISIAATGILEMQWGGVGIHDWWRNEQFWVIGGFAQSSARNSVSIENKLPPAKKIGQLSYNLTTLLPCLPVRIF